jgi:hypothetical protein
VRKSRTVLVSTLLFALAAVSACEQGQPTFTAARPLQAVPAPSPETPADLTMTAGKTSVTVTWAAPRTKQPRLTAWSLIFDTRPPITLYPDTLKKVFKRLEPGSWHQVHLTAIAGESRSDAAAAEVELPEPRPLTPEVDEEATSATPATSAGTPASVVTTAPAETQTRSDIEDKSPTVAVASPRVRPEPASSPAHSSSSAPEVAVPPAEAPARTLKMAGHITVFGLHTYEQPVVTIEGDSCYSGFGFDDVNSGASVTVYDATGAIIATTQLGSGVGKYIDNDKGKDYDIYIAECRFPFTVNVPESDFYQVEVTHRGKQTVARSDAGSISLRLSGS